MSLDILYKSITVLTMVSSAVLIIFGNIGQHVNIITLSIGFFGLQGEGSTQDQAYQEQTTQQMEVAEEDVGTNGCNARDVKLRENRFWTVVLHLKVLTLCCGDCGCSKQANMWK